MTIGYKRPDRDIMRYLVSNVATESLVEGRSAFNCVDLPTEDGVVDELAVFVTAYGGESPSGFLSSSNRTRQYAVHLQIRVRGPRRTNGHERALDLAWECLKLLDTPNASLPGYTDVKSIDASPFYQGEDGDGRHNYSFNARAVYFE